MWSFTTWLGLAAAILTTAANVPQVLKSWRTRDTGDLSLAWAVILAAGLALWVSYGLLQDDLVIVIANAAGFTLATVLIVLKLRFG